MATILTIIESWLKRLKVFSDLSAWLLIAPACFALWWVDPAVAKTLLQWSLFGIVMAGVAVMISRLIFPDLSLHEFVKSAAGGNVAASIVAAAVIAFVAAVFIGMVVWAKP